MLGCLVTTTAASAAVGNWQKGVSIRPRWDTDFGSDSFKQSVRDLKATNADYATLIIPYYQSNPWTTDIFPGWNTPSDESLISGIQFAHSIGLQVNLKLHVETHDGQWRANINPGDRDAWFRSYGTVLKKYARIAKDQGVEEMTIGAELINMAAHDANWSNTANWNTLIGEIRALYGGKLTYSANWGGPGWTDEKNRIQFWPALDYIGVSAYYPIPANTQSVDAYKAEWAKINDQDIRPLHNKFGKPVLFTEVGYRSIDWTRWAPFEFNGDGNFDPEEQARLYEALYSYWNNQEYMRGVHWWEWSSDPNAGGQWNKDYTPQNKAAEAVMAQWHGSAPTPTPDPDPTPSPNPTPAAFSGNASVTPASTGVNQTVSIAANFTNNGGSIANAIIDIEIYDSSNGQVMQRFYDNQSFSTGQTRSYAVNWTPTTAGTFAVRIGAFNGNWTQNYFWDHNAATIAVSTGTTPPPTGTMNGSATLNPPSGKVGETERITATIHNGAPTVTNAIVDIEVYNASNQQMMQKFYENQTLTQGQSAQYSADWTPSQTGTYTVRIGVFNNNWTHNYFWNHEAGTVSISEGAQPAPQPMPGTATIQIWWPTEGSSLSGAQPFKAMVEQMNVNDYTLFWQVDGGVLNEMYTSDEGYPHKEIWVDVSNWNWQQNNQYLLTFVVKDRSGNVLGSKSITITVTH